MDFFKKHREAVIGVLIYIGLMIALLLFLGLYKPDPPPVEQGIVLDFGGSGSGSENPGSAATNNNNSNQNNSSNTNPTPPESNMTQDNEEAPSMPDNNTTNESDTETPNNETNDSETTNPSNPVNDLMNNMNWGGTSDSEEEGGGNPGTGEGGEGGTGGGEGPGSGNVSGNGWSLAGRAAESIPKPVVANCDGYVIVQIVVNRSGSVVNAYAKPGGCTACDSHCVDKAVGSAKQAKFNSDDSADANQVGTITYHFRPN